MSAAPPNAGRNGSIPPPRTARPVVPGRKLTTTSNLSAEGLTRAPASVRGHLSSSHAPPSSPSPKNSITVAPPGNSAHTPKQTTSQRTQGLPSPEALAAFTKVLSSTKSSSSSVVAPSLVSPSSAVGKVLGKGFALQQKGLESIGYARRTEQADEFIRSRSKLKDLKERLNSVLTLSKLSVQQGHTAISSLITLADCIATYGKSDLSPIIGPLICKISMHLRLYAALLESFYEHIAKVYVNPLKKICEFDLRMLNELKDMVKKSRVDYDVQLNASRVLLKVADLKNPKASDQPSRYNSKPSSPLPTAGRGRDVSQQRSGQMRQLEYTPQQDVTQAASAGELVVSPTSLLTHQHGPPSTTVGSSSGQSKVSSWATEGAVVDPRQAQQMQAHKKFEELTTTFSEKIDSSKDSIRKKLTVALRSYIDVMMRFYASSYLQFHEMQPLVEELTAQIKSIFERRKLKAESQERELAKLASSSTASLS